MLYSFLIGISIGVIYSVFNTISMLVDLYIVNSEEKNKINQQNAKNKIIISKIFQFSIDFFFSVVYTVIVVVFIFCANRGKFRFFMLVFALWGFVLYKLTVGRLVSFCIRAVLLFACRNIKRFICYPVFLIYLFIKVKLTCALIKKRITDTVIGDKEF